MILFYLTDQLEMFESVSNEKCSPVSKLLDSNLFDESPLIMKIENESIFSGCLAGGEGSSSCSMEGGGFSCDVECNDGYYSCCGWEGCKCVKEGQEEED
jgi:hypothetical protein